MAGKEVAVVSFAGANLAKIDINVLQQGLANAADQVQVGSGTPFLKMLKQDGTWVYGAQDMDVEPGSKWAINPLSMETGWIAWGGGGKPQGKMMRSIFVPPVRRDELPTVNTKKGWEENIGFQMQCISGEDVGVTVEYTQNSYGGRAAFADIVKEVTVQVAKVKDTDPTRIVPVIVMKNRSYQSTEWGLIYNPIFEVVDWIRMDGSAAAAPVEEEQPAQPNTPAAAAAPSEAQPARTRRFAQPTNGATPAQDAGQPGGNQQANTAAEPAGPIRRRRRNAAAA